MTPQHNESHPEILSIPVNQIDVLNTRKRNESIYADIEENIKTVGLKKPITVTPRKNEAGDERFLLVCGEGRLRAFRALGEQTIPAQVIRVTDEDALIMSLAENIGRRHYRPLELFAAITRMREQGHSSSSIAKKTGLSATYVSGVQALLHDGEERVLAAVEAGKIPLHAALKIVAGKSKGEARDIKEALLEALEAGQLKPADIAEAKKVAQRRAEAGKGLDRPFARKSTSVTSSSIVRTYREQVAKQQLMVRNADITQKRLLFIVGALSQFFAEEHFTTILRAEGLETLPQYLADRIDRVRTAQ